MYDLALLLLYVDSKLVIQQPKITNANNSFIWHLKVSMWAHSMPHDVTAYPKLLSVKLESHS